MGGTAPLSSGDHNAPDQVRENLDRIPAALMAACDECAAAVRKSDLRAFGPKKMCPPCFAGVLVTADATMHALLQQNPEPERRCSGCAAMIDPNVGSQWCSVLELGDTRALLCQNFVPIGLRLVADSLPLEESSTADEVWSLVCGELGASLGPTHLDWLAHANATSLEAGILTVGVPDEYIRSWLVARLMPAIWQALEATGFSKLSVEFVVGQSAPAIAAAPKVHRSVQPIPLQPMLPPAVTPEGPRLHHASGFNPSFSFEQFVVGTGNRLAHAGALSVAEGASNYNPLFIYGGVGVGKTHLLQAIGGRCVARGRAALYVASETFTNELIAAIRTSSTSDFRQRYRDIDVLLVDDIHFIIGKESTQAEFFHTFNWLYDNGKQIVLSSDRAPDEMRILDERLRSRFWWGLTADIQPADFETRAEILRRKARLRGRSIGEEVVVYLAGRTTHNVRELEGLLNRLLALADVHGVDPSMALASGLFTGRERRQELDHNDILQAVSAYYRITASAMSGKLRSRNVAVPRHIAMYLMREDAKLSFPQIGDVLGGRDHSTVIYGCKRIGKEMTADGPVRTDVAAIRGLLFQS